MREFKYLGSRTSDEVEVKVSHRFSEEVRLMECVDTLKKTRGLLIAAEIRIIEAMVSPKVLYSSGSWVLNAWERS